MKTTGANGMISTLPRVSEMRTALPRVQQAATLPRVPTDARGWLNEPPATAMPPDAQRRFHEPPATTTPTTHTMRTNDPPAMTMQPVPSKPHAPRSSKNHQPSTTGGTRTQSMIARNTAHAAPPASQTRSKTEAASATQRRFERMENEVHQALAVMDKETGRLLNYRQLLLSPKHKKAWSMLTANKFGCLAQGVGGQIKGTNTIKFIHQHEVPADCMKDVTYGQFVCTECPKKTETNRTQFTVGGNRINYPGVVATPTAEMLVAKLLFNSTISTSGARFMTMDISNFYLNSPLPRPEFICIKLSNIPEEIIKEYKLRDKATSNGSVYIMATKGMYGLPQAGLIANELLELRLNKHGNPDKAS